VENVFVIRQPRDGLDIMAALKARKPQRAALVGAGAIGLEAYGAPARLIVGVAGAVLLIIILRALGIM